MKSSLTAACGLSLLFAGSAWAVNSEPTGGSFHDAATWGGTMPATTTTLNVKGPGEVVFSTGKTEWKGIIDVRGIDEDAFRASRKLVGATAPVTGAPALYLNGVEAGHDWQLTRRDGGRELWLTHAVGTVITFR